MTQTALSLNHRYDKRLSVIAGLILAPCVVWMYWPTLVQLSALWANDPKYSHGYVVPLFALFLFQFLLGKSTQKNWTGNLWGIGIVVLGLLLRGLGTYLYYPWLAAFSILPVVAGAVICVGGNNLLRRTWPAVAFLILMLPLPYRLESALAGPLQQAATSSSVYVLQTLGFPAYAEGNIILLGEGRVNVAEACNGLSMIMVFAALAAAVATLSKQPLFDKALILISAIPIAVICNVVRIAASALLYVFVGHTLGELLPFTQTMAMPGRQPLGKVDVHDVNGWLMMPLALVLLWLEIKLLSWVLVRPPARPGWRPDARASRTSFPFGLAKTHVAEPAA